MEDLRNTRHRNRFAFDFVNKYESQMTVKSSTSKNIKEISTNLNHFKAYQPHRRKVQNKTLQIAKSFKVI